MIVELQKEWNNFLTEEKKIKEKKLEFLKTLNDNNLYLKNDIIFESKDVLGVFWDLTYYSQYVGEVGAMYDIEKGSSILQEEEFEELKNLLKDIENNKEAIEDFFAKITKCDYFYESLDLGEFSISESEIKWKIEKESYNQMELTVGSTVTLKKCKEEEINNFENLSENNVF